MIIDTWMKMHSKGQGHIEHRECQINLVKMTFWMKDRVRTFHSRLNIQ